MVWRWSTSVFARAFEIVRLVYQADAHARHKEPVRAFALNIQWADR